VKILSLNPYIPHPLNSGGNLRSHHIVAALVDSHEVTFASQWRCGEQIEDWDLSKRLVQPPVLVPCPGPVTTSPAGARLMRAAPRPWFGATWSLQRSNFEAFWDAVARLPLDQFDAVQVRTFHLIEYALAIRALHPRIRLVLDLDDVQSILTRRAIRAARTRMISRWRALATIESYRIRLYERRFLREFDAVWVCSDHDRSLVAQWVAPQRIHCIPNGVDAVTYAGVQPAAESRRLIFAADFRNDPNEAGIRWFCETVFPEIRRHVADAEVWLVGRDPSEQLRALNSPEAGVHVTGAVPSMIPYLEAAAVSIVPLHVGAGTRLKILEAMAAGLPVVSTAIGAEGIDAGTGASITIANTPMAMARACIDMLNDPERRARAGAAGRQQARDSYDWSITHRRIRQCYDALGSSSNHIEATRS
jgi:glycosyltransferase involved in cell wall biosynthesis